VGISLLSYRRSIAVELGPFVVSSTSTASGDLVSFTAATLVSGNACGAQFQHHWIYLNASTGANLSAQRQVATNSGYDPDNGSVTVARSWATSVTSGVGFEILSRMPAITDELGNIGIREVVNDTLMSIPPIDLIPVTGVTSQEAYDVTTTYPWLTEKSQILGIYFQDVTDEVPKPTNVRWEWHYDVDAPRLLIPSERFITGQTFHLKVRRPAQSWIETNGTWAADTDGLQNDTDEALPLIQVVRAQALSTCYRMLGARDGPDSQRSYFREREQHWLGVAYAMRWWQDQKSDEDVIPNPKMVFFGARYGAPRSYR
jgi:hypothetical protein